MKRVKISQNFYIDEYIPELLYKKYIHKPHLLIGMLNKDLIEADQILRNKFGAVTINDWWNNGDRNWSGIRTPDSSYYSFTSQHSWGNASDKIFKYATAEEVREFIKIHWQAIGITCIEDKVDWVHSDVRFWQGTNLLIVQP